MLTASFGIFVLVFLCLGLYFTPTLIAFLRKKSNLTSIFVLNLLLGWSFIGWVVSLVWALSNEAKANTIIIQNSNSADQSNS